MKRLKESIAIAIILVLVAFALTPVTAQDDTEGNRAIVENMIEIYNNGNLDALDELISPDFVLHDPLSPEDIQGPEGLKAFWGAQITAMPGFHAVVEHIVAEGNLVAVHLPVHGTFTNPLGDIPPTGEEVLLTVINIWKVVDGQVVEAWYGYDSMGWMQQLGVVPGPEVPEMALTAEEATNLAAHVRLTNELFNGRNLEVIPELYDPDMQSHIPGDVILYGYEGAETFVNVTGGAFPDLYWIVTNRVPAGDTVYVDVTGFGTFTGDYMGIPANGNRIKWPILVNWTYEDGMIVSNVASWDNYAFMQQLGALPGPELVIDEEVTREVATRAITSWNQGSREFRDMMDEFVAPTWSLHEGGDVFSVSLYGHAGWEAWATGTVTAFPDFTLTIEDVIVEGDLAVIRYRITGTHTGDLMGMPPTGAEVEFVGTNILRVLDGQVTEIWATHDSYGLMQQLGALGG